MYLTNDTRFTFGMVGSGRLGLTITMELFRMDRLDWVLCHTAKSRDRVLDKIFNKHMVRESVANLDKVPNMIIIAVPDRSIRSVSEDLAKTLGSELKGKYVIHLSGVLKRDILDDCKEMGAITASVHPFQTFYYETDNPLQDIRWGVDSSDEDYPLFASFVNLLFGFPVRLSDDTIREKALYHAVATSASNYMTTIIQLAHKIADSAQIDASQFLPPIAKTTLGNNLRGLTDSKSIPLTGPIAREDIVTIRLHIDALKTHPEILKPYCHMGLATLEMARNAGIVSEEAFVEMEKLYKTGI